MAQEKGNWWPASNTAQSITGAVTLSEAKISINFTSFPMAQIRAIEAGEASAVFDVDSGSTGTGSLYRLSIPATRRFLHKNTLCGSDDTQWMVTYVVDKTLHLAFFSGAKPPVLTPEALSNSTEMCGTYSYGR
jgi:hypothetical protein